MGPHAALNTEVEPVRLLLEVKIRPDDPSSQLQEGNHPLELQKIVAEHQGATARKSVLWMIFEKKGSLDQEIQIAAVPGPFCHWICKADSPSRNERRIPDFLQVAVIGAFKADPEPIPGGDRPLLLAVAEHSLRRQVPFRVRRLPWIGQAGLREQSSRHKA